MDARRPDQLVARPMLLMFIRRGPFCLRAGGRMRMSSEVRTTMITPALSTKNHSGDPHVSESEVDRFDRNVIQQMPLLGPGLHPRCFVFVLQLK